MKRFRRRGGEFSALEATLRADRPRPSGDLEREIAERDGGPRARRGARPALALLMTTGAAAAFFSLGGVGYAVDAVNTAAGGGGQTASDDQYGGPCTEYVNPHGKTIPPAGLTPPGTNPNGGENPDGFYQVGNTGGGDVFGHRVRPVPRWDGHQVHAGPGQDARLEEDRQHERPGRCGLRAHHRHRRLPDRPRRGRHDADLPGTSASEVSLRQPRRLGSGGPSSRRPSRFGMRHAPEVHVPLGRGIQWNGTGTRVSPR
jgi:hypothetical protein